MKMIYAAVLAAVLAVSPVHVALDGFLVNLEHEAVLVDGRVMIDAADGLAIFGFETDAERVAIRDVAEALSLDIDWEEEHNLVRLATPGAGGRVPPLLELPRVLPYSDSARMTFAQALARVNERDGRLVAIEDSRIIVEREQREIDDYLSDNSIRGRSRRNYTVAEVQMLRAREQVGNHLAAMPLNERLLREGNEMRLLGALADIARAELDVAVLLRQVAVEEQSVAIIELMYELGMESDAAARDARSGLARTRTNLENAQSALENHRLSLNTMLGLTPQGVVEITDLSWEAGSPVSLNAHLQEQLATAPNLALLQLDLEFAEYVFFSYDVLLKRDEQDDYYRYRGRRQDASVVIEMRNDINAAERALNDARDALEARIRSLNNDIEALLEQQAVAQADLANAIEDYAEAMLRYMTGVDTWLTLERAKLGIASQQAALARHEINLAMLTLMYQRPYLN